MPQSRPDPAGGPSSSSHGTPSAAPEAAGAPPPPKPAFVADLNAEPPESDGDVCATPSVPVSSARNGNDVNIVPKSTVTMKDTDIMDGDDVDQQRHGASVPREDKVCSLKAGLVHMSRKMPKNAHAQFILGLMYQRLGQPLKAILAYEKSSEILQRDNEEIQRPAFLSLVLVHHAECLMQANFDDCSDKELEADDLEEIIIKLKTSMQYDAKQAAVWNSLGLTLLKTGRVQSAVSVLSCLLEMAPDCLDCLANLGIAHLQRGNLDLSAKCFQDLLLKDQHHPAALVNYAALLLCKYGSTVPGPGANAVKGALTHRVEAANVAKECLLSAARIDPKAGPTWVNLANAYYLTGDHRSAKKCLQKAAELEPNQMSTRYAVAIHRIKDAERSLDCREQLSWAANEMASVIKEGDPSIIDLPIAWTGLAMVHKAQYEIASAFETQPMGLTETENRALFTLKKAIVKDPDDVVPWNQLGLHSIRKMQLNSSVKYLKTAVSRCIGCSYSWCNLGIALQLSNDPCSAEQVYRKALSMATKEEAHVILSNLGNLYRQEKRFEQAKTLYAKCLELRHGYPPAENNLGLVYVAEGQWDKAKSCFEKALLSDPLLDAAKSNMMKVVAISQMGDNI